MKEIFFLNGKFLSANEAKISVLEPGFLYGWGLFETMRSYKKHIVYFDAHLKRIKKSCALIAIEFPYPLDRLKEIIQKTIRINGFPDAYVRLTLWKSGKGTDILVMVKKYQPYPLKKYKNGFHACISRFKQNENSFLARLKSSNYLLYRLAYLEAKKKGLDEAIILNNRGYIAEGSHTNIFLVKDKEVFTPRLECGCLDGITRKAVLDLAKKYGIKVYVGNFTCFDLYEAKEIFLSNSLIGIMPLTSIGKHKVGKKTGQHKLTSFFIEKYKSLLLGNEI